MKYKYLNHLLKVILIAVIAIIYSSCVSSKKITTETKSKNSVENKKIKSNYALLLKVDESKITNISLYAFIDDWYGVPYKYGGSSKTGIDCSNFVGTLIQKVYNKNIGGTAESMFEACKSISKSSLKEGDLVFFKIDSKKVSHVGVYLQNNKFVHASTRKGIIISDLDEEYYKKYYFKAGKTKD